MPQATPIILQYPDLVKVTENKRSNIDARVKIDYYVYQYRGTDGEIYRKSFETRRGETPIIPERATHAELNALNKQW